MKIKTVNDKDVYQSPIITWYSFSDTNGNTYEIKAERIIKNSFLRFARNFQREIQGHTELFEQMAKVVDINSKEVGSGMMEHLRTHID